MKNTIIKKISVMLLATLFIMTLTSCKGEESTKKEKLTPKEIFTEIMTLTEKQDYDSVAAYCRSFSPYSVQLYFDDTDTAYEAQWTERYSKTLYKLFDTYVTYKNVKEDFDEDERVGTVTATFTSIDLEAFNDSVEYKVNTELKNDFEAQMNYLDTVAETGQFMSDPFTIKLEFRYSNKEWRLVNKNFLILLTLGYYA